MSETYYKQVSECKPLFWNLMPNIEELPMSQTHEKNAVKKNVVSKSVSTQLSINNVLVSPWTL